MQRQMRAKNSSKDDSKEKKKNNKLDQSKDKEKRENTQILKSEIK